MRKITTHKVNPCNDRITIEVLDEPGDGGACHHYLVFGFDRNHNPDDRLVGGSMDRLDILFQNGPIPENGTNGITQEVLLAIIIDRLQCFQRGPFSCRENALALTKLEEAMHWLHYRTRARMERNDARRAISFPSGGA